MDQDTKRKMQEALAEKRKRLQDIKDSKKNAAAASASVASPEPAPKAKEDLDSFLKDINTLIPKSAAKAEDATPASDTTTSTTTTASPIIAPFHIPRRKYNLSFQVNVIQIDIPPKETPTYTKGTQTDATSTQEEDTKLNVSGASRVRRGGYKQTKEEEGTNGEGENNTTTTTETQKSGEGEESTTEPEEKELPELSQEEKDKIFASTDFQDFFEKATRAVDRALFVGETLDIMEDYKSEDKQQTQVAAREAVLKATFFDDRWSKHRSITDLAWSTKHPELIVAAYSANEAGTHDADGCCLVWNVNTLLTTNSSSSTFPSSSSSISPSSSSSTRRSTPEFVFSCQSQVTTAQFSKFHATMVVGGTYSGQIVLWDTRAKSMPVQRTPLSAVGHTHPVYSLSIVGSANAHNLVSISTDGRLCVWSLENLSHPTETLELSNKLNKPVTAPVAVTSLSFPEGEVNSFLVGSEEGAIFQGYRHGTTSGITERYDGHFGPITATDFHPARGNIDFSHLFLSSSTDWSCKLWSSKHGTRSLYSFEEATDYIYDTRWSPTHPAVFATADGNGIMDVWNLNEDTEAPVLKVTSPNPNPSSGGSTSAGGSTNSVNGRALNRVVWSADGKRIVSGDAAGYVYLYDVGDIAVPDANEWNRFEEVLSQMSGSSLKNKPSSSYDEDSIATPRDSDDFSS